MKAIANVLAVSACMMLIGAPLAFADDVSDELAEMRKMVEQLKGQVDAQNEQISHQGEVIREARIDRTQEGESRFGSSGIAAFLQRLVVEGHVSGSYFYNFNNPGSATSIGGPAGTTGGNTGISGNTYPFHGNHNSFQVDQVWFGIEHPVDEENRAGFRFDLLYGTTACNLGNAVPTRWKALSAAGRRGDAIAQHAPRGPGAPAATRVVWIVFDELDYRLTFEDRPIWIDLPEFDALRGESFFATHAIEASSETGTALSSLLLGRPVHTGVAAGATELMLRLDPGDAQAVSLRELPNFFTRVREMSLRLGIVGIYHPYCRLFPDVYAECVWEPFLPGGGLRSAETFTGVLLSHAYKLLPVLYYRGEHIASAVRSVTAASAFAADPELDVVFIHLPIPHPPYIYDAAGGDFTLFNFSSSAYIEQLALADRALGEIRRAMEKSEIWRSSVVLVTSDHGRRFATLHDEPRDHRVPFLLKLAGQPAGFEYEERFPTWRAAKLLRGVLTGGVARPDEIAAWLGARGTPAPSGD